MNDEVWDDEVVEEDREEENDVQTQRQLFCTLPTLLAHSLASHISQDRYFKN